MIAMVWSTTSGGVHYLLDGSTSMIQWCICVCVVCIPVLKDADTAMVPEAQNAWYVKMRPL